MKKRSIETTEVKQVRSSFTEGVKVGKTTVRWTLCDGLFRPTMVVPGGGGWIARMDLKWYTLGLSDYR